MGAEIRPSAVVAQLASKKAALVSLQDEIGNRLNAIDLFTSGAELSGRGYDAARERVGAHADLLSALSCAIDLTLAKDDVVASSLAGHFGALAEVSEDYWLEKRASALAGIDALRASHARAFGGEEGVSPSEEYVYQLNCRYEELQLQAAEEMLAHIGQYLAETSGLYADALANLEACIAWGQAALAGATYDVATRTWGPMDTTWMAELAGAVDEAEDEYLLLFSEEEGAFAMRGDYYYIDGRRYDLRDEGDNTLIRDFVKNLTEEALSACFEVSGDLIMSNAQAVGDEKLRLGGILEEGTIRCDGKGYVVISGFRKVEGTPKLPTRMKVETLKDHPRMGKVLEARKTRGLVRGVGRAVRGVALPISGAFFYHDAATGYNETYEAGAGLPEDRRLSNAEAAILDEALATAAGAAIGTAAGSITGAIATVPTGPGAIVGGAVGGIIGAAIGTTGADYLLQNDVDGNGLTGREEVANWYYEYVFKPKEEWLESVNGEVVGYAARQV